MTAKLTLAPVNLDFNASITMNDFAFEFVYPLELTEQRFTALMKLPADTVMNTALILQTLLAETTTETQGNSWQGLEAFILEGTLGIDGNPHPQGSYIRIPVLANSQLVTVTDCIVFIKLNQFLDGDTGTRIINTRTTDKWLPGPADGIEIRPLHVYDTESIMLLRWHNAAEFRPKLNPQGEEILVINGLLQNRDHLYRQYSWIRNPIEDWRKWHGNTGTLAYYKSGHFPDDPARTQAQ